MTHPYKVILNKTSFHHKEEMTESMYDYEFATYDEALKKYDEIVASESLHISNLWFVKSDAVIKVVDNYGDNNGVIRRRVKISN